MKLLLHMNKGATAFPEQQEYSARTELLSKEYQIGYPKLINSQAVSVWYIAVIHKQNKLC